MNGGPESAPGCSNHIVALENASKHIIFRPLVVSGGHFEGRSVYFAFLVASFCCVCVLHSPLLLVRAQKSNAKYLFKMTSRGDQ